MTGSFENLEADFAELEDVAFFHGGELVFGLRAGAEIDVCTGEVTKFEMAGDEIGVKMGEKNVANLKAVLRCEVQIALHITLGIDDCSSTSSFVTNQVRSVGQAAEIKLFENHVLDSSCHRAD